MKKPIIGITIDYITTGEGYSDLPYYALRRCYSNVIEKNGGVCVFLPFEAYKHDPEEILNIVDGIVIPGGDDDVPPEMYNDPIKFGTRFCHDRAYFENILIRLALERNLPILGICHGMQLLNVVCGGNLYQSIVNEKENALQHKQGIERIYTSHDIELKEGSKLFEIIGKKRFKVNSHHKQAVKDVGKNLIASAICPDDGIIEAIESENHDFVLGVEWHPEIEASHEEDNLIFKAFVDAARRYKTKTLKGN